MDNRIIGAFDETGFVSQCSRCKHKAMNGPSCAAFPEKIPDIILNGSFDHRLPFDGDMGIRFDPLDNSSGDKQ